MVCLSLPIRKISIVFFFFFNDTATTEIYTLSLHDALPISHVTVHGIVPTIPDAQQIATTLKTVRCLDRKSTRLNSSHSSISYAVFCLKKKKNTKRPTTRKRKRNTTTTP